MRNRIRIALLFVMFLCYNYSFAQKQRNYIYVFDCTASMKDYKIYEPAKKWLHEDIDRQADDAMITIIPFRDYPDDVITFEKKSFDWKKIEDKFNKLISSPHMFTGICRAWDEAVKNLNPEMENYFYVLTDGENNPDGKLDTTDLLNHINSWCEDHPNDYGFYVTLSSEAKKIIPENISCDLFKVVDGSTHLAPFGVFVPDGFTVSLREIKQKTIGFSTAGKFSATATCDDPYFNVRLKDGQIADGVATFLVEPKSSVENLTEELPISYQFTFSVLADENVLNIVNDQISVNVENRPVRNIEIVSIEQSAKVTWYDKFLFWGAKKQDTIHIPLRTVWNNLAKKYDSEMTIHTSCSSLNASDYTLLLNGKEVSSNSFKLSAQDENDVLSFIFSTSAPEGKHFIQLQSKSGDFENVETVNDEPVLNYDNKIRLKYDEVWNPMKWFCFIIFLILFGLLLLWFFVLKRIFYPTFKIKRIQINEPYYKSKTIKGARLFIMTAKNNKQNIFNRWFKGKIIYEVNSEWIDPIEFTPFKKGAKVKTFGKYSVEPYTLVIEKQQDYTFDHVDSHVKMQITVN